MQKMKFYYITYNVISYDLMVLFFNNSWKIPIDYTKNESIKKLLNY